MNKINKILMKERESKLSHEKLTELLGYNPETGIFTNKTNRNSAKKGESAGAKHHTGYIRIGVSGIKYSAHRLAWFYIYKKWPSDEIDHINRNRADNRINNLREATAHENTLNTVRRAEKTSNTKGIIWNKIKQEWMAYYNGKYLGYTKTIEEAKMFQREAEIGIFKNRARKSPKQSGVRGIVWHKGTNKWKVLHNNKHLCLVDSIDEGIKIKQQAINGTFTKRKKQAA